MFFPRRFFFLLHSNVCSVIVCDHPQLLISPLAAFQCAALLSYDVNPSSCVVHSSHDRNASPCLASNAENFLCCGVCDDTGPKPSAEPRLRTLASSTA